MKNGPQELSKSVAMPENKHGKLDGTKMGSDFVKKAFEQIVFSVDTYTKENKYVITNDEKKYLIKKNKISFLEKLELLIEDEYNCIVKEGLDTQKINKFYFDFISNLDYTKD